MKKSIILILRGGLGNQMFQYAFAKNLAITTNSILFLDTKSGFFLDAYKRYYELNNFNINDKKATIFQIITYNSYKLYFKIAKIKYKNNLIETLFANFIYDASNYYSNYNFNLYDKNIIWIEGYWQSYLYFNKNIINENFIFKFSLNNNLKNIAKNMLIENSVAICLRFYEETTNPNKQSHTGLQKSFKEINSIIKFALNTIDKPKFYVFTLFKSNVVNNLIFKDDCDVTYITSDNNFSNTFETIWLQTHCKHHIIMNSTYYWWGAYLSQKNHVNQYIYIDSNFLNQDIFIPSWIKF